MQAGLLNEMIEIYSPILERNEYGEQIQTYVKVRETKAQVIHHGGSRSTSNNEVVFEYQKELKIRRYISINENYQISFQGKMYRILSIEDNRQYNYKTLLIEEINA